MLKQYTKDPIFKDKEQPFRIRKIFYRIERQKLKDREVKIKKDRRAIF